MGKTRVCVRSDGIAFLGVCSARQTLTGRWPLCCCTLLGASPGPSAIHVKIQSMYHVPSNGLHRVTPRACSKSQIQNTHKKIVVATRSVGRTPQTRLDSSAQRLRPISYSRRVAAGLASISGASGATKKKRARHNSSATVEDVKSCSNVARSNPAALS